MHGTTHDLPDTLAFLRSLDALDDDPVAGAHGLLDADAPVFIARAPGRLDVMGGIADYSGSLVLQMPIREATHVALQVIPQPRSARSLKIISLAQDDKRDVSFEMPLDDLSPDGVPLRYEEAQIYFAREPRQSWAAYAAGAFLVLMHEREVRLDADVRVLISSHVPEGKGVSSSAAIEVAVMSAACAASDVDVAPRELALLCHKVENLVVGAPCGVMDQTASVCGAAGELLALLCQPAELQGTTRLPEDLAVWGIDSGVRHSVGAGDYGSVRTGAFIGYRMIAEAAHLKITAHGEGEPVAVDDKRWNGYLANVTPSEFEAGFADLLPEHISGGDFLSRYTGTTDSVTRVDPRRTYAVRQPTAHPIYEHHRVRLFAELLKREAGGRRGRLLGELMYQSHLSYSRCGLGSDGTDLLVDLVREAGAASGLYGAKITGGGSGGTVAVLGRRGADDEIVRIADAYRRRTGHRPHIFTGSSPGAASFGNIRLARN